MTDNMKCVNCGSLASLMTYRQHSHGICDGFTTILFYAREMQKLAEEVQSYSREHRIELGDIEWKVFPDNWPNIFIHNSEEIRNSHVLFLASFHNPQTIFEQISLLYHLPKYLCRSLKILLPYFPTGTMERIQIQGEIATAYSFAQMLSSIPVTRTGPCEVVLFDIHALQNQFYFSSNVIVRLESTVGLLLDELNNRENQNEKFAIAFPDDGAHKRFAHMFEENKYSIIICSKIREVDKRITTIKEGNPTGYHCIIIDDLVQSGGTLIECAQALLKAGAVNISAFVAHGIFPNESWKKFIHSNNPKVHFDTFYVTNTYPNTQILIDKSPFKIFFTGVKAGEFSIYDQTGKNLKHRIESRYNALHSVELVAYPSKQIIARLKSQITFLLYKGTLEILDVKSNKWITGTINHKLKILNHKYIINWNGKQLLMTKNVPSFTTKFFDETQRNQVVAEYRIHVVSSTVANKYTMKIFTDKIPDALFLLCLTVRDHIMSLKKG
ncbi:unnamed protein product [Rotaria sordida]|uniref:Phosphoribosyltransferase domain-containing protein n=1 Tax=Rotaria sordida TaxID=392033 RepID=A0A814MPV1_9BILA|nr:unnamed protein product [Rotaria sordida]CAF1081224.1 unnamed protein product [Rotaria sordida]CAF1090901.1 unnamed protein product [Rotaria sordida]CAF1270616.1 unnamed protein product [Rotaria sordida]CAF3938541.1 unnamed protein product [Rotaria sordida]